MNRKTITDSTFPGFYEKAKVAEFFQAFNVAEDRGQQACNDVVLQYALQPEFRTNMKIIIARNAYVEKLRRAVLALPVLDYEFVTELMDSNVKLASRVGFRYGEAVLLSGHKDFDEEWFFLAIQNLSMSTAGEAGSFITYLNETKKLPLTWILNTYAKLPESSLKRTNIGSTLVEVAAPHFPDMPLSWVAQMLESLSLTKEAAHVK